MGIFILVHAPRKNIITTKAETYIKKPPHGNFSSQRVPKTSENEVVLEAQMRLSALTHRTTLVRVREKCTQNLAAVPHVAMESH